MNIDYVTTMIRKKSATIEKIRQSPLFDETRYRAATGLAQNTDAVKHYLKNWKTVGVSPSEFFDPEFYTNTYADIRQKKTNPLKHYVLYGWKEGRAPSPSFDRAAFLKTHPGIDPATIDPAAACVMLYGSYHWRSQQIHKLGEGSPKEVIAHVPAGNPEMERDCRAIFDNSFYASMYRDVARSGMEPFQHYMQFGHREDRSPSAAFDTFYYRRKYLNNSLSLNPLEHYISHGRKVGLSAIPSHRQIIQLDHSKNRVQNFDFCVHLHCYYPELLGEFASAFRALPAGCEVIITVCTAADQQFVENYLRSFEIDINYRVELTPNVGRDIASFLIAARKIWSRHEWVLHLHTKRSPHITWGDEWRRYLIDSLIGSTETISAIGQLIADNPNAAVVFPENFYEIKKFTLENHNIDASRVVLNSLGVDATFADHGVPFPAGSMGFYRTSKLNGIADRFSSYEMFDEEKGQLDRTVAHVLERIFSTYAYAQGGEVVEYQFERRIEYGKPLPCFGREASSSVVTSAWPRDTPKAAKLPSLPLAPLRSVFNGRSLELSWVIPSFQKGAGGHMTIFRMISFLAKFGHRQTVWIQNAFNFPNEQAAKSAINNWYIDLPDTVHVMFLPEDLRQLSGDAIIATDCWTAFPVSRAQRFLERFYLVQDHESEFHPTGENRLTVEQTYQLGLAGLCAGRWLEQLMQEKGMWARSWDLCADHKHYFPAKSRIENDIPRIAFYARPYTPRRAVQLGFAALEVLHQRGQRFRVDLFGEDNIQVDYDFPHTQHGVLDHDQLADLYRSVDIGLVFSATNYSLIPLEMAACGLPVVELDVPSTRKIFENDEVCFAQPTPIGIADAIESLLNDRVERQRLAEAGRAYVSSRDWEHSARDLEAAIFERLKEKGYESIDPIALCSAHVRKFGKASVVIPTFNAGKDFRKVLDAVTTQATDFKYDVVVVDSASTDETPQIVQEFGSRGVRLHAIEKQSFQHGATRNLGISLTDGAYTAVLTQDALPANDKWLENLLAGFKMGTHIGGVTGRHHAYLDHGPFIARDLEGHFQRLAWLPNVYDPFIGLPSCFYPGSPTETMLGLFYSDNNSAVSRSVWEKVKYPEIEWGEDYVFARNLRELGFQKAYVDNAIVIHSHGFEKTSTFESAIAEGRFWAKEFGIKLVDNPKAATSAQDAIDQSFALQKGLSVGSLRERQKYNKAVNEGRHLGWKLSIE